AKDVPERSSFRSEAVLRWRLREANKQLQLVTEELNRTRSMLAALQRAGGQGRVLGSEDGQFGRLLQSQEDLKDHCDDDGCDLGLDNEFEYERAEQMCDAECGEGNADPLWRRIRHFVAFAFGHARRGTQPANRYLGFRVKELCEQFYEEFAGEASGVYEAVMHHARRVEIERNVEALLREKIQKKRKPEKLEKEDSLSFDEIERDMADRYNQAFEEAGGIDEVQSHVGEVSRGMSLPESTIAGAFGRYDLNTFWCLDCLVRDPRLPSAKLELNVMTPDYFLLPRMEKFNLEVQRIASHTIGIAQIPPLKGYSRARTKVLTRYGNDCGCLTDVMRASVIYNSIEEVYSALRYLLREDVLNPRPDLAVVEVNDRFQNCRDGYRDISLLFDLSGVICELQLHIKGIIDSWLLIIIEKRPQ
ncbi:unnamed protein product, partial [Symbiodinium microadriaticum]